MKKLFLLIVGLTLPISVIAFTWEYVLTWDKLSDFYSSSQYLFWAWTKISKEVTLYEWHMIVKSWTWEVVFEVVKQKEPIVKPVVKDSDYWKERLEVIANEVGYKNVSLAKRIVFCESRWDINAANKSSSARWFAQFLTQDFKRKDWSWHTSTWTSSSKRYLWYKWNVFNWEEHLFVFISKLKNEWTRARNASKYCWNK